MTMGLFSTKSKPQMAPDYACVKCNNTTFIRDEFRATGSNLARFLNVQNKKFNVVSCAECGYTEIYRDDTHGITNILDAIGGG